MSEEFISEYRRWRQKLRFGKDHESLSQASIVSTPTTQSGEVSPSRTQTIPATGSQADPTGLEESPKPPEVEESTPEILPLSAAERLWDEAYDAIKHDDSKLVEEYEKILSRYLHDQNPISDSDMPQPNAIAANSPNARRQQMDELIRVGLDNTGREAKVKNGLDTAMEIVLSLKNTVSCAIAAVPQASLAWSGVCIALGVMASATEETASNRDGIEYIITRIRWYGNLSSVLLPENALEGAALSGMKVELVKRLVELYKALLIYQIKSVCSYYRNRSHNFLRNLIKLEKWTVSIQDIQKAENSLRQDAEVYGNQRFRLHLENIAGHADTQEIEIKNMAETLQEQLRRQISAEDQNCLRELWPHDPYIEKQRIEDTKGGLLRDSFRWILENDDFCRWFEDPNRPLLWIKGDPGKGKTMLLCGIVDSLQKLAPSSLISFFFCQATDERINNSTAVLRGLIFLLVDQRRHLLRHLQKHHVRQGNSLFESPSAWYALSSILQSLLLELNNSKQPTCLLIDALDECVSEELSRLLDFLVKMSKEFPYVKWVVTSRNWPQIAEKLQSLGPETQLSLELNADSVAIAVEIYIKQKVLQLSKNKGYSKDRERDVRDYLLSNANGTFLWVALVCQNIQNVPSWNVLATLKASSTGLDSFYEQMIQKVDRSNEAERCKHILAVVAVARRPLTLQELIALVESPGELHEKMSAICDLIGHCGSFLTIRDEIVYFVHQSAKDFLVKKATNQIFPSGMEKANHDMASRSIELMSETLKRDMYHLRDLGIHIDAAQVLDPDPLAAVGYSCVFWIDHLVESTSIKDRKIRAGDISKKLLNDVEAFLEKKYLYWLEALSLLRKMREGVIAARKLQELFKNETNKDSAYLVQDVYRFILAAKQTIENFPLQIHPLALLICPVRSRIRQLSTEENSTLFQFKHGRQIDWPIGVRTIETGIMRFCSIALSPDGKLLASTSSSGIRIWDMATGTCLKTLSDYPKRTAFGYLFFSPGGQQLAVFTGGRGIIIWNIESGELIKRLDNYDDRLSNLTFSPDGNYLAAGSKDDSIRIWDLDSGRCIRTLEGGGDIVAISFSPHNKSLASCSSEGTIKIWDADLGKCTVTTLQSSYDKNLREVGHRPCFSPDLSRLAFSPDRNTIVIWDVAASLCVQTIECETRAVRPIFSPNGKQLALVSLPSERNLEIWDVAENKRLRTLKGHSDSICSIVASPDGSKLITASADNSIKIWDTSPEVDDSMPWQDNNSISSMAFSPDGKKLATGCDDATIKIWDTHTEECVQTFIGHKSDVHVIAFSPDGRRLASGSSSDACVKIWDLAQDTCIHTSYGHVTALLKFSPDGQQLASISSGDTFTIWNIATGSYVTLPISLPPEDSANTIDLSTDGKRWASGSRGGVIQVWEAISGRCMQTLQHHMSPIRCVYVAFAPGGKILASGSGYCLKIWREVDGQFNCVMTLELDDLSANIIGFSPDGRQLISGSRKNTITTVWDFDISSGLATSRRTLKCDYSSFFSSAFLQDTSSDISRLCLYGLDSTKCWITRNGKRILRLPNEFRPPCLDEAFFIVHGRTVAILSGTNRLAVLSFCDD